MRALEQWVLTRRAPLAHFEHVFPITASSVQVFGQDALLPLA